MISITEKKNCCGCSACAQKCPASAITMQADNEGFLYPLVDKTKCIDCGICEKTCPLLSKTQEGLFEQQAYICQLKDRALLAQSTSGGVFSTVAFYVLKQNGVVFGATLTDNFAVEHCMINRVEDLYKLRGSKYVQSRIGETYKTAKEELRSGKIVLFSGTPCQIEGLLNYLGGRRENLITLDIVCHAVPSPKIWNLYVKKQQKHNNNCISNFRFRDKTPYGYQMSVMSAYADNKQVYYGDISIDPFLRAFFSNICDRPSCYDCSFKKRFRSSDITLWDCLNISEFCAPPAGMEPTLGLNNVLLHSEKGRAVWGAIKDSLIYKAVNPEALTSSAKEMTQSVTMNEKRGEFFKDAETMQPEELFQKYFSIRPKNQAEHVLRAMLAHLGITSKVRMLAKKFIKNYKR